ncbi:phosphotransferase enzyme family protein [Zhihengliuella salsuginis]|uniref:Aminoglycoside phosphotransferase n=1 Tax=Zhihengliuella salsuginis TaxID=578222 RepID=A0ABQ3GCK1_9MICC|nr:phosphotransferase [Zhihengliuella salsuginis]GHD00386.1 aminoglycoside phosphotransferase [Zhihengliuella salsuginis]
MRLQAATDLVDRALGRYGLRGSGDVELVKYRENYVFKLSRPAGSYAVRVHRTGYRGEDEIRTEMAYLDALAERGLPVPRLVRTLDGELLCSEELEGEDVYVDVLHWVEGASPLGDIASGLDGTSTLAPADFRALGERLGELHLALIDLGRLPGFARGAWNTPGLAGRRPLWGDPRRVDRLAGRDAETLGLALAALERDLADLPGDEQHFGVIHADLTPENVLVSGSGMTLIDFDDFGEGWHLFDLATALFFYTPHPRYEDFRTALFGGYQSVRGVPSGFFAAWDVLLLARATTYLGWAGQRAGDPEADFIADRVAPHVVRMAQDYLRSRAHGHTVEA